VRGRQISFSLRAASLATLLAVTTTLGLLAPAVRADGAPGFLSHISWTFSAPKHGVELLSGTYRDPAATPHWTVTVEAPTASPFDGSQEFAEAGGSAWASATSAQLTIDGFVPRSTVLPWPQYLDDPRGSMGIRVRVGEFATKADASAAAATLTADGFTPLVEWEGFDPDQAPDAELLHVAIVDPGRFRGSVIASHGTAIASRSTVATQAQQAGALAGINGGFFTIAAPLSNVAGVPTGLGVYDGRLEAMANDSRADLVLDAGRRPRIENLRTSVQLNAQGASIAILGVNRQPGSAEDCGVPGFVPTSAPRQGVICTGPDDLVLFTPEFGAPLPSGAGLQVTLAPNGTVASVGSRGGVVPSGDRVIQAIGSDAGWLMAHAQLGQHLSIREQLLGGRGDEVRLAPATGIVSAAPILLRDGQVSIDAVREGVFDPRDLFDYGFSAERHARTIAGVDRRGRLILVTADGVPGTSEGLTLSEEAQLMSMLGARDAMNLDGGGSTTFVVNGTTINQTSDATGPRPVGDSTLIVPQG
jgi:hypothetical protein